MTAPRTASTLRDGLCGGKARGLRLNPLSCGRARITIALSASTLLFARNAKPIKNPNIWCWRKWRTWLAAGDADAEKLLAAGLFSQSSNDMLPAVEEELPLRVLADCVQSEMNDLAVRRFLSARRRLDSNRHLLCWCCAEALTLGALEPGLNARIAVVSAVGGDAATCRLALAWHNLGSMMHNASCFVRACKTILPTPVWPKSSVPRRCSATLLCSELLTP